MGIHEYSLEELLAPAEEKVKEMLLHVDDVNLLTQVRQTIDDIDKLAEDIRLKGQRFAGVLAALRPHEAQKYVTTINAIRHKQHRLRDLAAIAIDGERYYLVMVAGHRRYYSVKFLVKKKRLSKKCDGRYRGVVHFGLSVEEALELQLQENHYKPVPSHEEAAAVWDLYCFKRLQHPKLTLRSFARSIGRTEEWLRKAVRYCTLPLSLQKLAMGEKRMAKIPYGYLAEAGRLHSELAKLGKPIDEQSLSRTLFDALAKKKTVSEFRTIVSARIEHMKRGPDQEVFLGMEERREPLRHVVDPQLEAGSRTFLEFTEQIGVFFGKGGPLAELSEEELRSLTLNGSARITAQAAEKLLTWLPQFKAFHRGGASLPDINDAEAKEALDLFHIVASSTSSAVAAE